MSSAHPLSRAAFGLLLLLSLVGCETQETGRAVIYTRDKLPEAQRVVYIGPTLNTNPYVWRDEALLKRGGKARVSISLALQRGVLYLDDQEAMRFPVCTGRDDSTPRGTFTVLEKDVHHRSNIYHVAMPYFMRLTWGGVGLHVGEVFNAPVSHGCIRLTREACIPLYRHLPVGGTVEIE